MSYLSLHALFGLLVIVLSAQFWFVVSLFYVRWNTGDAVFLEQRYLLFPCYNAIFTVRIAGNALA